MTDHDKIILELRQEIKQLKLLINDLIKSNDELKQKLAYCENPHSPPSQNSLSWRKQKAEKRQKNNGKSNRGDIPGHKGATQKFIPQGTTHHELSACPKCSSTNITAIKTKKRIMVSIPPPQPYEVTEHILHRYSCQTCPNEFQNDGNLPPQGNFDGSVIRSVADMYSKRMPYDTIKKSLQDMPICDTCLSKIEFLPYRIVSIADKTDIPKILHFHYFYPCWDLDWFFQKFIDHKILSLAFSCDETILEKPLIIRNMKENLDLWE